MSKRGKQKRKEMDGKTPQGGHANKYEGKVGKKQKEKQKKSKVFSSDVSDSVKDITLKTAHFKLEEWGRDYSISSLNKDTLIKSIKLDTRYGNNEFNVTYNNGNTDLIFNELTMGSLTYSMNASTTAGLEKEANEIISLVNKYNLKKGSKS